MQILQNAFASPYISSVSNNKTLQTDFEAKSGTAPTPTGNTIFKTSMALGGSKDPHLSGDKKVIKEEIYIDSECKYTI